MSHVTHRSPGITAIYNAVKSSTRNKILDLGECTSANLSFYSGLGCLFHFESANEELRDARADFRIDTILEGHTPREPYDIVLLWDIPNFLDPDAWVGLLQRLRRFIKPGALFHWISYVGARVPVAPGHFSIQNRLELNVTLAEMGVRQHAGTTSSQLLKQAPEFSILKTFISGEGMLAGVSEQILCYRPDATRSARAVFSSAEREQGLSRKGTALVSPAHENVWESARKAPGASLLDLGRQDGANQDIWKSRFASVHSEDLNLLHARVDKMAPEQARAYLAEGRFFEFQPGTTFDVIIAWDLLNYISDDLLEALSRRLMPFCHDGTRLFVMSYSGKRMPPKPQRFQLAADAITIAEGSDQDWQARSSQPKTSVQWLRMFPGFFVEHSYAFLPGMQRGLTEYIFIFKGEARLAEEKARMTEEVMARRRAREQSAEEGS